MRKRKEHSIRKPKIQYTRRVPGRWKITGEIVYRYREERGLDQKQFADALSLPFLKVSHVAVSNWERGDTRPSIDWLRGVQFNESFTWRRAMADEILNTGCWEVRYPQRKVAANEATTDPA